MRVFMLIFVRINIKMRMLMFFCSIQNPNFLKKVCYNIVEWSCLYESIRIIP